MKKIKVLSLLMALLLSSSLLLASCGSKKEEETESESETEPVVEEVELTKYGIADIMNASYAPNVENGAISAIKDPTSYKGAYYDNEKNYIITLDDENEKLYVYNTANDKSLELAQYAEKLNSDNTKASFKLNYVDVISDEYFAVLTMSYTENRSYYGYSYFEDWNVIPNSYYKSFYNGDQAFCNYTLTVYGADCVAVKTYSNGELYSRCEGVASDIPEVWESLKDNYVSGYELYALDLYKKDGALYRASYVDGKVKYDLVKDYGLAKMPSVTSKSGDYYLYSSGSRTYTVYNKDFSATYSYGVPSDASDYNVFLLANGSLLVQYWKRLDQDEKTFDFREGADGKYDITTLIVNADGEKELEDVDYYIYDLKTSTADERGNKMYSDKVENLAFICPIAEDKTLDTGLGNRKLVLLSNNCEVTAEVEIASEIIDFPTVVEKGFYGVETVGSGSRSYGYDPLLGDVYIYTLKFDLYNAEGKFVNAYESEHKVPYFMENNGMEFPLVLEKYTVTEKGIYDMTGALVYDAKKNDAKIKTVGDAIYVTTYGDGTEVYSLFLGADNLVAIGTKVIGSDKDAANVTTNKIEDFHAENGYYATLVKDEETSKPKATYYNVKGEAIASIEEKGTGYNVIIIEISDELVIFYETYRDQGGKVVYNYYKAPIVK